MAAMTGIRTLARAWVALSVASLVLRTSAPTEAVVREVREILRGVDPRLELLQATTLVDQIESTIVSDRLIESIDPGAAR